MSTEAEHFAEGVPIRRTLEVILADAQEVLERVPERGPLWDIIDHIAFNARAALERLDGEIDAR